MSLRPLRTVVLALVVSACALPAGAQSTEPHATAKQEARAAAASWLALVDDDAFGESWDEAAGLLQKRIKRVDWIRTAERLRDSVETLPPRSLSGTQYRQSLRRAPDSGPFVLLKYRSVLSGEGFEELVLTVRQDTTWKVAGYQVTPLRSSASTEAPPSPSP